MSPYTKNFLLALGATVIWFGVMRPSTPSNIVAFELARTTTVAEKIIHDWKTESFEKIAKVKRSIYLDFGFILAYCSAFMFAGIAAANFSEVASFKIIGMRLGIIIWLAGLFDCIENIALLKTLTEVSQTTVSVAFLFALLKFCLLLLTFIFILTFTVVGVLRKIKT